MNPQYQYKILRATDEIEMQNMINDWIGKGYELDKFAATPGIGYGFNLFAVMRKEIK